MAMKVTEISKKGVEDAFGAGVHGLQILGIHKENALEIVEIGASGGVACGASDA